MRAGRPVSDPGGCPGPRRRGGLQPGGGCHAGPALALLGSASLTLGTPGAHLPHRPPAARRSASSRGSRRSEAWRGPARGGGGRQSCRGSCGVGGGGSEGPVALTGRQWGDRGSVLTPGPPTPSPHPPAFQAGSGPLRFRRCTSLPHSLDKVRGCAPRGPLPPGRAPQGHRPSRLPAPSCCGEWDAQAWQKPSETWGRADRRGASGRVSYSEGGCLGLEGKGLPTLSPFPTRGP